MKSATHRQFGEPAEVLSLTESPRPEPGPGQVRIKTTLAAIHNHDLWTVRGSYGYKPELPAIGGSEAVGTIDALGDGVTGLEIGQRVTTASAHGTWAEFFTAPAAAVVPLPAAIPDETAAQLIAMPFSALTLLDFLGVEAGDWLIQNTANGAVGKAVAMLAAARGINTINLVRRDEAVAELADLGIRNAVSTAQDGWQDKARALTSGAPIRAAVDSIGGSASGDLVSLLAEDGLLVSFGTMRGEPMQIPSGDLIFKHITVKGFWGSRIAAQMEPEKRVTLMRELIGLVASGGLTLPVDGIFGLDQIAQAMRASLASGKSGKVLLRP